MRIISGANTYQVLGQPHTLASVFTVAFTNAQASGNENAASLYDNMSYVIVRDERM